MRLYVVRGDLAFSMLRPVHDGVWPVRGGVPVAQQWDIVDLELHDTPESEFIGVDCFAMNTTADGLIVSEFARQRLEPLLSDVGEFWPVRVMGRPYWWFNCVAVLDILDRQETDADWSVVKGDWGSFRWITGTRRLAFQEDTLSRLPAVFRIPEYPQGVLFGSEALEDASRQAGLTGFLFDLIWSADDGGVEDPPGIGFGGVFQSLSARELARKRAGARTLIGRREGGNS